MMRDDDGHTRDAVGPGGRTPTNPLAHPFPAAPASAAPPQRLGMLAVLRAAREAAALFTPLPVDQITSCAAAEDGWRVRLEVVEMKSRVGGNDLLSSYEVRLDPAGTPLSFERIGKAHRERATES